MSVKNDWLILEISLCKSQAFKGRIFVRADACDGDGGIFCRNLIPVRRQAANENVRIRNLMK